MTDTKKFPTNDVLSVITGRLMGQIDGVCEVLNWMTGEHLFTHQLPRVSKEATPVILEMHPHLQSAMDESDQVTQANWQEWRDRWFDQFGPVVAVPKFTADQHEYREPMSELAEKVHPDKIITVATGK